MNVLQEILYLVNEMSPYLLFGFLLAGILHVVVPGRVYSRYLSQNNFKSVVWAALFGVPLPLCSCGVIPTAMSLRKEGASLGATTSFLIATPQTGVDSIIATYGMMGLPFAILRPIAALVTSLGGGALVNLFSKKTEVITCNTDECNVSALADEESKRSLWSMVKEALTYSYYTMMQDIGKWLVIGLVLAGIITVFVPNEWFLAFKDNTMTSMLLVLCIAVPMYLCATGSIPIAIALMMKGLTPGAALVMLMAGPACNIASMVVVRKVLGRKVLALYLLSITLGAIGFGVLIDWLQFDGIVDFLGRLKMTGACCMDHDSWWAWTCTVLLCLILFNALVVARFRKPSSAEVVEEAKVRTFSITGMNCNHCSMSVEKAIKGVEGVTNATVDLQKAEAYVEGDASSEAICHAVDAIGFGCEEKG